MDFLATFDNLKGKALDVAHIDLLKSAYELQAKNIDQLKTNNAALQETNGLLKEKIQRLEDEKSGLTAKVGELEKKLAATPPSSSPESLSASARAILEVCFKSQASSFTNERIFQLVKITRLEAEAGLGELVRAKLARITGASIGVGGGTHYSLTHEGTNKVLEIFKQK